MIRDPSCAGGTREHPRPTPPFRPGTEMSVMNMTRGAWCAIVAGAALGIGGCKKGKAGGAAGFGSGPMGMPVEVAVARADTVRDEIAATGQIEAVQSIDLRPEVDGRIVEILVREGQEVEQETPLFKVDDAQLKAQVAQLEAQRDLARQALARAKDLAQQNASSAADLEKAEAEARSAQAQYDLQKIRLDRTTVRAPFPGAVGQRYVSLGDYVTTSTRLTSLHTVNPQRASFQVPERFARDLKPGQQVSFRVAAIAGRDFTGEVDGKANRRQVELGVRTPGFVEVTKGVNAGEQVVVGGLELLAPGAPVTPRVVDRRAGAAAPAAPAAGSPPRAP